MFQLLIHTDVFFTGLQKVSLSALNTWTWKYVESQWHLRILAVWRHRSDRLLEIKGILFKLQINLIFDSAILGDYVVNELIWSYKSP